MWLDKYRIKDVLEKKLFNVSRSIAAPFYDEIGRKPEVYSIKTKNLMGVFLLNEDEYARVKRFESNGYLPFPALYTTHMNRSVAFKVEKGRNVYLKSNTVENAISLSIGPDSTIVLQDHVQKVNTSELGSIEYKINLAFLISFGDEIDDFNSYEYLEDLIAYTIKSWRGHDK
ncbi:hypothetical protein L3I75_004360 [Vibrio vulnificus]|uniref:hypothetical protein n=1 Tax=Vibrio vulnificus TaxID=672 RepID=UPI0013023E68|nr:hypothetical protein [Vibrio vulnificus]EIU7615201.1 hypothetical protein [Vibrio vulnificus]EIU7865159.1 hypothetical protein [Vibrio vulnificus]EJE8581448.1 hypothetical protein [Vibrio vulnificus]MCU8207995.1 hypothetical protein [Vibrio vulnificus]HAS8425322.1 hypothetical protein [Vibrio vulnificus]